MAYTNMTLTLIAKDLTDIFWGKYKETSALIKNTRKYVLEPGVTSKEVILPGAVTTSTRVSGGNAATMQSPTDTKVTLTPATEYGGTIFADRLEKIASPLEIPEKYGEELTMEIVNALNDALWAKYSSITTNSVGADDETASIKVLPLASKKLFAQKIPRDGTWTACIGGEEDANFQIEMDYNTFGMNQDQAIINGIVGSKYGFNIAPDQGRASALGVNYNLAFQRDWAAVAYRSSMGSAYGSFTEPNTGITIFTRFFDVRDTATDDSTFGVGEAFEAFAVADIKVLKETHACLIKSLAE